MNKSKAMRVSALLIGASVFASSLPLHAQSRRVETSAERRAAQEQRRQEAQGERSEEQQRAAAPTGPTVRDVREQRALAPLQAATQAAQTAGASGNWAAAQAAVAPAEAAVRSNEGRYYLEKFKYAIAVGTNNVAGQEAALNALVANSTTPAAELPQMRRVVSRFPHLRAEAAYNARDYATAERIYREILAANPSDEIAQRNLSVTMNAGGNTAGSLELVEQQIRTAEAGGGKASEALYRQAWDTARRGNDAAVTNRMLTRLLTNYPTPTAWRAALEGVRSRVARNDVQHLVDVYRLIRLTNTIQRDEYLPLANTFGGASLLAETKSAIEAGIAAGGIQATQSINPFSAANGNKPASQHVTEINARMQQDQAGLAAEARQARTAANGRQASNIADTLSGYGRFAEAADLYRVALTKGGVDANLVNIRLGAALAQAGQRAEAETAFRAVTGPRAELASLWLIWLANRPAG